MDCFESKAGIAREPDITIYQPIGGEGSVTGDQMNEVFWLLGGLSRGISVDDVLMDADWSINCPNNMSVTILQYMHITLVLRLFIQT